eukprot:4642462-Prymnesium_polylepis.2
MPEMFDTPLRMTPTTTPASMMCWLLGSLSCTPALEDGIPATSASVIFWGTERSGAAAPGGEDFDG